MVIKVVMALFMELAAVVMVRRMEVYRLAVARLADMVQDVVETPAALLPLTHHTAWY